MGSREEKTRHLLFNELNTEGLKTKIWEVMNTSTDAVLGRVKFLGAWRKYVFTPITSQQTWFDANCLREIADFTESETSKWRIEKL